MIYIFSLVNSAILNNANLLQILNSFAEKFRAPKPLPIYYDTSIETKLKLMKAASSELDLSLKWIRDHPYKEKFLLFISKVNFEDKDHKININQEIYFLMKVIHGKNNIAFFKNGRCFYVRSVGANVTVLT